MEFKCCTKSSKEEKDISKIYAFLRAVSDPNRLKIICILKGGSQCVCELVPKVGISDKLVSHHLKHLKDVGLVIDCREGNFVRYSLDKKTVQKYKKLFNQMIEIL